MRFACRTCRKEVKLDGEGIATHLDDSPACMLVIAGRNMPDYDKHEVLEDESTLVAESSKEEVKIAKKGR